MSFPNLARSVITLGRSRLRPHLGKYQRAASTKLPKGFVPPAAEDLTELRERVQDFTRKGICKSDPLSNTDNIPRT
jgi:isovaleryl-CoA dehydrogenase